MTGNRMEKGFEKSSICQAREERGARRTCEYVERRVTKRNTADGLLSKPLVAADAIVGRFFCNSHIMHMGLLEACAGDPDETPF